MSSKAKTTNVKAGKWNLTTLVIKKAFREEVAKMATWNRRTLWVRIQVTTRKKGKTVRKTVHHHYVVRKV